jgi:hypothetical protein
LKTDVVRIANPQPNGSSFTNRKAADRYVNRGRARYINPHKIAFIEDNHEHQAAIDQATGYDRRGLLLQREMRKIPIVNPAEMLREHTRPRRDFNRKWAGNGRVKIVLKQAETS